MNCTQRTHQTLEFFLKVRRIRLLNAYNGGNVIRVQDGGAAVHLKRCLVLFQVSGHLCHCRGVQSRQSSGGAAWTDNHSGHPAPSEGMAEAVDHK